MGGPACRTPVYIARALGRRLERTLSLADIGMAAADRLAPDLGLTYPTTSRTTRHAEPPVAPVTSTRTGGHRRRARAF